MNKKKIRYKKKEYRNKNYFHKYPELKQKIKKVKNLNIEIYSEYIKMIFSDETVIKLEKKLFNKGILNLKNFNNKKLVININFFNKKSAINTIILPNLLKSIYITDSGNLLKKIISNNTKIKKFKFFIDTSSKNKFPKIKNKIKILKALTIKFDISNLKKNKNFSGFVVDLNKFLFGNGNIELDIETNKLLGLKKLKKINYDCFVLSGLKNTKGNISKYISNLKAKDYFVINNIKLEFLKLEKHKYDNIEINNSSINKLVIKNSNKVKILDSKINNFYAKNINDLILENTTFKNKIILKNCKKLKINAENIYPDNKFNFFDIGSLYIFFDITKNNLKSLKKILNKYFLNVGNKTVVLKAFIMIIDEIEDKNNISMARNTIKNTIKILKYLYLNLNQKINLEEEISIHNFTWSALNNEKEYKSEILLNNLSRLVYKYIPIYNHLANKGIKNTKRIQDFIKTNIENNEIHPEILKCLYEEKILKKNLLRNVLFV